MAAKGHCINMSKFHFIVVGGGIAGISCAQYLAILNEELKICLISSTELVKAVTNVKKVGQTIEEFDVVETPLSVMSAKCSNVEVVKATVVGFDHNAHKVITSDNEEYYYGKLCICSGASPNLISHDNPHVLGLRDLQSVEYFQSRLSKARRVIIVGNGGIALELAYELHGCQVVWVIKDDSIGNAYFDKGAAQFFLPNLALNSEISDENVPRPAIEQVLVVQENDSSKGNSNYAGALGSSWKEGLRTGRDNMKSKDVHLEYKSEVKVILTAQECGNFSSDVGAKSEISDWNIYVELTNGKTYGCDFVVSATGVVPNTEPFIKDAVFDIASDGGFMVDDHMRTNIPDVYAAGDVCSASWEHSEYWMQMRLWTQAKQMGAYAAKCMLAAVTVTSLF